MGRERESERLEDAMNIVVRWEEDWRDRGSKEKEDGRKRGGRLFPVPKPLNKYVLYLTFLKPYTGFFLHSFKLLKSTLMLT